MTEDANSDLNATEKKIVATFLPLVGKVALDGRGRRMWQGAPDIAGKLACAIILAGKDIDVTRLAHALGMNRSAITQFTHGRNLSANPWKAIRGVMQREGVYPIRGKREKGNGPPPITVAAPVAKSDTVIAEIAALFAALPKLQHRGQHKRVMPRWRENIETSAKIAALLIGRGRDTVKTCRVLHAIGCEINPSTVWNLTRGKAPDMQVWPELRAALKTMGVAWYEAASDATKTAAITAEGFRDRYNFDRVPVGMLKTNAVSAPISSWRFVDSDIHITTTTVLRYGTPEHAAKMREIMLNLGTGRDSKAVTT